MDGFVTAIVLAVASGVLVLAVTDPPGSSQDESGGVSRREAAFAAMWFFVVVAVWIGSHEVESLQRCTTTSVVLDAGGTERTTDSDGSLVTTKDTVPADTTSTECAPVGAAEMAILLIPSVVAVRKGLKGFSVGPFGVDLRERVQATAREETARYLVLVRDNQSAQELIGGALVDPPEN